MFSQDSGRVKRTQSASVSFGDIAVLYRLNSQHRVLKEAFARSGIPFCVSVARGTDEEADLNSDIFCLRAQEPEIQAEKVSLMSLHAAKGLEFPVVFIVGCEAGLLPLDFEGLIGDKEEERRLFYVGMTRAKQGLFLTRAKRRILYGKIMQNASSPFLSDIEEELKEHERTSRKSRPRTEGQQLELFS